MALDTVEIDRQNLVFLMTHCWIRHQYAEIVLDQKVPTCLESHGYDFEWFGGVPTGRIFIYIAQCAVAREGYRVPVMQLADSACAEVYSFKIDDLPPREP